MQTKAFSPTKRPYTRDVPPAPLVVLFDGRCRFCTRTAKGLARRLGPHRVRAVNFQDDGALAPYPGITHDAAMERMHAVAPDGGVYAGAHAVFRLAATLPLLGWVVALYRVPGVAWLSERLYAWIARRRYALFGRREACDPGGTCDLHG